MAFDDQKNKEVETNNFLKKPNKASQPVSPAATVVYAHQVCENQLLGQLL